MNFAEETILVIQSYIDVVQSWDLSLQIATAFFVTFIVVFIVTMCPLLFFAIQLQKYFDHQKFKNVESEGEVVSIDDVAVDEQRDENLTADDDVSTDSIIRYSYVPPQSSDNVYEIVADGGPNYYMTVNLPTHNTLQQTMDHSTPATCAVFYKDGTVMELKEIKND